MVEDVPEVEEVQIFMVLEAEKVQGTRNGLADLRLFRLGSCRRFEVLEDRDVQVSKILEGMYAIFEDCGYLPWSRPQ